MTALDPCHLAVITCFQSDGSPSLIFSLYLWSAPLNGRRLFSAARGVKQFTHKTALRWFTTAATTSASRRSTIVLSALFTSSRLIALMSRIVNNHALNCSLIFSATAFCCVGIP